MWYLIYIIILAFIAAVANLFRRSLAKEEVTVDKKVLVVTGCDSGIGHSLALAARTWGITVVGTCLAPSGKAGNSLKASGAYAVKLDLMEEEPLKELLSLLVELEGKGKELWAVVNNAGVLTWGACEWQTKQQVTQQVQVNLTGAIQVTSSLLPKIRRNKGRIVLVSSPTGQVAAPNMSAYCASKFGIEGFAQSLRREIGHLGVKITVVRPCNLPSRTGILRRNASRLREMLQKASQETKEDFGDQIRREEDNFAAGFGALDELQDIRDSYLIQCFRSAILSPRPEYEYAAAPLAVRWYLTIAQVLPTCVVDFLVLRGFHDAALRLAQIQ